MSPHSNRTTIWEATNLPAEPVWYYAFVRLNDKTYKVKIGKANKAEGRDPEYGPLDPGIQTKLVIRLWHKVGDWDVGTEMSFTSGDGKMWFQGLIEKTPSLNDALKYEDAEYSIEVRTDETTGQAMPELRVQMGTGSQVFELKVEDTRNLSIAGVSEPITASEPDGQDTGSTTESGAKQTELSKIREVLPPSDVKAIYTTEAVHKVVIVSQGNGSEYKLKRSGYTTGHGDYIVEWRNEGTEKVFSEGSYRIIYYGLDDQELGNEDINVISVVPTNT